VLRCFDNDNIVHVDGNVNPIRDKETIDIGTKILKTLKTFGENRAAKTGNKEAQTEKRFRPKRNAFAS
jgi:ribosome-binding ATPase YchF (GTP1/OBG family)